MTCNNTYAQYAAFVAWQLSNTSIQNFDIYIASDDQEVAHIIVGTTKFLFLDNAADWKKFNKSSRLSYLTYLRIPAIEKLSRTYEKILYLDTDIYIATKSIHQIFEIDMLGFTLAAVRDSQQRPHLTRHVDDFKVNKLSNAPYFNAGVLLVCSHEWVNNNYYGLLLLNAQKRPEYTRTDDQTLFNVTFHKNWLEMSPVWNWMINSKWDLLGHFYGARFIHVAGDSKLWNHNNNIPRTYMDDYNSYLATLGKEAKNTLQVSSLLKVFLTNLILSLRWYRTNKHWLSRFSSALETVQPPDKQ